MVLDSPFSTQFLGDKDAMLRVDIRVYTKDGGEELKVTTVNTLPRIIDDAVLPEAPRNFEEMFHAVVSRPVLSSWNSLIQKYIDRGRDEFRPALPERASQEDPEFLA